MYFESTEKMNNQESDCIRSELKGQRKAGSEHSRVYRIIRRREEGGERGDYSARGYCRRRVVAAWRPLTPIISNFMVFRANPRKHREWSP